MRTRSYLLPAAVAAVAFGACKPAIDERSSEVQAPRILGVTTDPAEWIPVIDPDTGTTKAATMHAVVGAPSDVKNIKIEWAFCTQPKPLAEINDFATACLDEASDAAPYIIPIGEGIDVSAVLPTNACTQFGPQQPENPGGPPLRPADPDVTGGYYQPVRLKISADGLPPTDAFDKFRILCDLPNATTEQHDQFVQRYHRNANPQIASVLVDGQEIPATGQPGADAFDLAPGQAVNLRVTWPVCPLTDACKDGFCGPTETGLSQFCSQPMMGKAPDGLCCEDCATPHTCGGAERFLAWDTETRTLNEQRESMRVSWFVIAGNMRDDRTGQDATSTDAFTENVYTAPSSTGDYPVWIVLRDSRGGMDSKQLTAHVH